MKWSSLLAVIPVLLALFAAPVATLLGQAGTRDDSHIYLISAAQFESALAYGPDVREIGPFRAPLARFVRLSPAVHDALIAQNYWIIPGSALAGLCGFGPQQDRYS